MRDLGNSIVANIHTYWEKATDPSAKSSVIWILGEFGHVSLSIFNHFEPFSKGFQRL